MAARIVDASGRRPQSGYAGTGEQVTGRERDAVPPDRAEPRTAGRAVGDAEAAAAVGCESAGRRRWIAVAARWLVLVAALLASVAFAAALARITLVPEPGAVGHVHDNLRPGNSLRHYLWHATVPDALRQVGGNVLLGAPFGLLLPVLWPKARGLFRILLATAALMLLVEVVQGALLTGRAFDVDDIILNTGGAVLGYLLLGRRLVRVVRRGRTPHAAARQQAEHPADPHGQQVPPGTAPDLTRAN
ncbi:VanZ family protein [Kitasatospora fiedleri]|uniref:VanZ family protein n=1 Tax=Kitasatospora fiedleri TaxID=2991545 RepID=UPI00249C7077|nr:VanZ family protein [Kitasatospora fiedleri]